MTDLSPAAQAVLDAVGDLYESDIPEDRDIMIATLCAAADQVVPHLEEPDWGACNEMQCDIELYADHQHKRAQLLAIAAELRGKGND